MQSILVSGGDAKTRQEKALTYTSDIPSYDVTTLEGNIIGIKEIRSLITSLHLASFSGKKVAMILEAQNLSHEAQNALLKMLEEPPNDATIILTSPNSDALLPTIVSRCQIIELKTNEQTLTPEEEKLITYHLSLITGGSLSDRLKLAQDVSKTKEEALAWLERMIIFARDGSITQYAAILSSFQKTHIILQTTNVNPRLALENLFISLETERK